MLLAGLLLLAACSPDGDDEVAREPVEEPATRDEDGGPPPASDGEADPPDEEPDEQREEPEPSAPQAHGVSAGHPDAVEAGIEVLEQGGTAADAAIAAATASAVVEPFTSGLGGGGAALVLEQGERPRAYDYRDVVPADGIPPSNTGVPGFLAGMERLRVEHGTLDLDELLAPAISLADGAEVSGLLAERLASDAGALPVGELDQYYPDGAPLPAGATMVQPELADTLRTIAEDGAEAFYDGELAARLAGSVPGIDAGSLADYEVQSSTPPSGTFADLTVIGAAPALPGTSLIQQLQLAETLDLDELDPGSADFVHALGASWRIALARQQWELGDPDFVEVPVDELTDVELNRELADANDLALDRVPVIDPNAPLGGTDPNTTHITAVDSEGTMVSMTNTITNFWGSRDHALGFFLNDHLRRFDLGQGGVNQPEPGRRPVTWSLPTIVADDEGRPVLGLGSPGGPRIPNVLAAAIARWGLHDQPLEQVVEAPRFHVEGTTVSVESGYAGLRDELLARGWTDVTEPVGRLYFGSIQALEIDYDAGELRGATDPRREADHRIEPVG
ncbi:MAG: gamma-glutamyltransferase family protein [Nitriliruptoraceae bacterium]